MPHEEDHPCYALAQSVTRQRLQINEALLIAEEGARAARDPETRSVFHRLLMALNVEPAQERTTKRAVVDPSRPGLPVSGPEPEPVRPLRSRPVSPLSEEEQAVIDLLAGGLERREVAARLGLPDAAVKAIVMRLSRRWEIRASMLNLVIVALHSGATTVHPPLPDRPNISPAQARVLDTMLDTGGQDSEIAKRLFLSIHTVKVHLRTVAAALGTSNKHGSAAAWWALKQREDQAPDRRATA